MRGSYNNKPGFPHHVIFWCWLSIIASSGGCSIRSVYIKSEYTSRAAEKISESAIAQSVFLIGDAGEQAEGMQEPVLGALQREASKNGVNNLIVFLGDNIYESGMPEEASRERPRAERRLNEEIQTIERSGAQGIFIPGNHDWDPWSEDGVASIKRQNDFVAAKKNPKVRMSPLAGFPGPDVIDVGARVRLVTLDTEWWLHRNPKPLYPGSSSEGDTKKAVIDSLSHILSNAGDRYVIVVGHHPLDAHGTHSGFFDWRDHLFPLRNVASWLWIPLPGLGSLYPLLRNQGLSNQDFSSSAYREMRGDMESLFSKIPPLVYAAGHEHTLEVLKSSGSYLMLVSGYGTSAHDPSLTTADNTIFAHRHPGFMRLDISDDGRVRLAVIEPINDSGEPAEVFSLRVR